MSLVRFPHEKYASVELNQVAFPKTGMVVSQMPLGSAFTEQNPCENGMWVVADKAVGTINAPSATIAAPIGVVYTTEKEYNDIRTWGLKMFGRKIAGDYPRVGLLDVGDTITSNCFQYDDTESGFAATAASGDDPAKTAEENMLATVAAFATTPVYVAPVTGSPIPKLTKSKPGSGLYAKVVKFYTMPNGEKGIKYQIVNR